MGRLCNYSSPATASNKPSSLGRYGTCPFDAVFDSQHGGRGESARLPQPHGLRPLPGRDSTKVTRIGSALDWMLAASAAISGFSAAKSCISLGVFHGVWSTLFLCRMRTKLEQFGLHVV